MRAAISTDLLSRLMNATPEQYAAVAKILGVKDEGRMMNEEGGAPHPASGHLLPSAEKETAVSEDMAGALAEVHADLAAMRVEVGDLRKQNQEIAGRISEPGPASDSEAVRVFALMKSLDAGKGTRKAPLERVFRLLVLDGLSQEAAARRCQCSPGLISLRVADIERRMGRPVEQLRTLASRLGEMDASRGDERARAVYRRGLTDDTGSAESD
jgi:hypothetical protein